MVGLEKIAAVVGEKQLIPMGIVIMLGYVLIWAVKSDDRAMAHENKIMEMTVVQAKYVNTVQSIDSRLSRIEWALKIRKPHHEATEE